MYLLNYFALSPHCYYYFPLFYKKSGCIKDAPFQWPNTVVLEPEGSTMPTPKYVTGQGAGS